MESTYTLTFGDVAENHAGMQKIGTEAKNGFDLQHLLMVKEKMESLGAVCELSTMKCKEEEAHLLIVRGGVKYLLPSIDGKELITEMASLEWDKVALMRGRVVNKRARHNLCFATKGQKSDVEKGKGTIIPFSSVPLLHSLYRKLSEVVEENDLMVEGNHYYDIKKCYIGMHGDSERKKVIGVRLGADFPLHFQWYHRYNAISDVNTYLLSSGDVYLMSEKATGNDWKKSSKVTLRHAAGTTKGLLAKKSSK